MPPFGLGSHDERAAPERCGRYLYLQGGSGNVREVVASASNDLVEA